MPPGPLYALIALLAAVENIFPPVPADVAVALGAFLSGRGVMNPWLVFALTWIANVSSGAGVYALARRHGALVTRGFLGRHIFTANTVAHIEEQYRRHLIPMALASAVYYGALTYVINRLGIDLETVLALLRRVNSVLAIVAGALILIIVVWIVRRRRQQ